MLLRSNTAMARSARARTELMFQVASLMYLTLQGTRPSAGRPSARGVPVKAASMETMGTALITGATSGIGRQFAWALSDGGWDIVLVARNLGRLEALAENLRRVNGVRVEILQADLSKPDELEKVTDRLKGEEDTWAPVELLINNAGLSTGHPFLESDLNEEVYALDVMVKAVMTTSYYAAHSMKARGKGAIINISSVAAQTGMGTYSANKAWVLAFTEGLAEQLRDTGVTATAVIPGLTNTEFHERAGVDVSGAAAIAWTDPSQVVKEALDAARRGQVIVTTTWRYKLVYQLSRVMPRSLVRAVSRNLPHM